MYYGVKSIFLKTQNFEIIKLSIITIKIQAKNKQNLESSTCMLPMNLIEAQIDYLFKMYVHNQ